MGQAKLRRESLRKLMLKANGDWDFPPSSWEADIVAELLNLPVVVVPHVPAEQLTWMRMPANECHANVRWYVKNDSTGTSQAVSGWWVQWPNFVLHSVIDVSGNLCCVTPSPFNETQIEFISDPKIIWVETGELYSAVRNGQTIGPGVRRFPEYALAQNAIVRDRLLSGIDPYHAVNFTDDEISQLKREHIR